MNELDTILGTLFTHNCAIGLSNIIQTYSVKHPNPEATVMFVDAPTSTPDCPITKSVYLVHNTMKLSCDNYKCQIT